MYILINLYIKHIVNKYSNTYHRKIKIKPVDVKSTHILVLVKKIIKMILNLVGDHVR